ncbi:IS630 family transposase [Arthrobacter sp. I2-34]|uniref:IS630 family transposase n=1 Tax=Arthrobacter hankyongi TaxID=2904801 RepID=A0ABS9L1W4_9MICC|nr:IS630 family transposase [Arthrobacter hankyongi]MCG2620497.1 IS630 family transposase [Arthrobacter hankyongi]
MIVLTDAREEELRVLVAAGRTRQRDVLRARIVLAAARGDPNAVIARDLGVHPDTVRKWRKRFASGGPDGLADLPRSGRPRTFTPVQVALVKALACTPPPEELALSRWSVTELAHEAVDRHVVGSISAATVARFLAEDAIKPWQHSCWIHPRDPDFGPKAARVLDLYARTWDGEPLGPDEYVISADEKSQLQALHRIHPATPPGPGRPRRVEFGYRRGGTLAYFAAYDVHRAKVTGTTADTTGIAPFAELVEKVMTTGPYTSAHRVFWVVDNGASHQGQASVERMAAAWPNAVLVHLPVHASWLNQVEIYFSILQRKALTGADFAGLDQLTQRIFTFQDRYNTTAKPFGWKYTKADLNNYLKRLARHEQLPA